MEPEKKDHSAPAGATTEMQWTGESGKASQVEASSGWIILRQKEKPVAEMFHTHYRLADAKTPLRPITFVFNGGPGAASAYLHIGGLGPLRAQMLAKGDLPPPPARLLNNTESWIEFTDLVFIDPIGTGFSRVIEAEPGADNEKKSEKKPEKKPEENAFYALNRDLESLGEFIERFLSKHNLWDRPIYIAGESYGGFRTAKLARRLQEKHGIGLSAVIAISPALEWSLLNETDYDVLRYVDTFCAMALAAAHHGRSRMAEPGEQLESIRAKAENFATRDLAHAYLVGTAHDRQELERVFRRAAAFLGLDDELVLRAQGRVPFWRFARELLRSEQRVLGFYDASITAVDPFPDRVMHEGPDPTLTSIARVFESGINQLLRARIGVQTERRYETLSEDVYTTWKRDDLKHAFEGPAGSVDDLRFAMSINPHMRVLITHGHFDLVTPYFSSERLVGQMKLLPEQRRNLSIRHFPGGHMFYTWDSSRREFRDWVRPVYQGD